MWKSTYIQSALTAYFFIVSLQVFIYPSSLLAGTFRTMQVATERCNLMFEGPIVHGDSLQLERILPWAADPGEFTICLNSPGGLLVEGTRMARIIAERGVATLVPSGGVCTSACAVAFLGGTCQVTGDTGVKTTYCRFIDRDAVIGFHAPFIQALENSQSESFTAEYVRDVWSFSQLVAREYANVLSEFGVPMGVIMDILAVNPDDMSIVRTVGAAREMNIIITERYQDIVDAEIYIETCASALRSPEKALRDLYDGISDFQLSFLEDGTTRIVIAAQLSFLNFPYATWQVCRVNYRDYGQGIYPHYVNRTGSIIVENCGRVITEISDSLETTPPVFRLGDSGRVETMGAVLLEDECKVVDAYFGPNADMWRALGGTEIISLR